MLRTAPCEWASNEVSSFSSVIDFSSEKHIVFTGQQVLLVPINEDKVRSRGHSVLLHTKGCIQDSKLYPKCIVKFMPEDKKNMKKGYKYLMIGTTFCKFLKIVLTNHIFKIFYVYTKVPNSAKKFDHKILDWCPWNVYCQSNSPGQGECC